MTETLRLRPEEEEMPQPNERPVPTEAPAPAGPVFCSVLDTRSGDTGRPQPLDPPGGAMRVAREARERLKL